MSLCVRTEYSIYEVLHYHTFKSFSILVSSLVLKNKHTHEALNMETECFPLMTNEYFRNLQSMVHCSKTIILEHVTNIIKIV